MIVKTKAEAIRLIKQGAVYIYPGNGLTLVIENGRAYFKKVGK